MSGARALAFAAIALAALIAGLWVSVRLTRAPEPASKIGGYVLDEPRALPAFDLVDNRDEPFHAEDFAGHWSFLYFGYTYCPDICPLAMLELAGVKKKLDEAGAGEDAEYYLVSVDPARDTPERIGEYVEYFDPSFRGITGRLEEIDKLAKAASVVYVLPDAKEGEPYIVGHSSTVTLIDPAGRIHAIFTEPLKADPIAEDFRQIAASYGAHH